MSQVRDFMRSSTKMLLRFVTGSLQGDFPHCRVEMADKADSRLAASQWET